MGALIVLPGLIMLAALAFVALAMFGILFRIALRIILLPLLLLKWIVAGIVMLIVGPILFVVAAAVMLAAGLVFAVPLLPLLAIAALIWVIVKSSRRPAIV
jgi:hypothetical protein